MSVWIGEIQWMRRNGFAEARDPILKPLDTIECRDAILTPDGIEPNWPEADVVIGNPPFLGGKLLRDGLGDDYVELLQKLYASRLHGEADLVCHWFDKAARLVVEGKIVRAGLVATNSIRGGRNRSVLDRIIKNGVIFDAWCDEPWVIDGAAVRVSLVCFSRANDGHAPRLDGQPVDNIHADLTAKQGGAGVDLTGGEATDHKPRGRLHGRHERRTVRHSGRSGAGMAAPSGQPERSAQRRRSQALDERHGPDPPLGGQMDRRFRLGHGGDPSRAVRGAVRLCCGTGEAVSAVGTNQGSLVAA